MADVRNYLHGENIDVSTSAIEFLSFYRLSTFGLHAVFSLLLCFC